MSKDKKLRTKCEMNVEKHFYDKAEFKHFNFFFIL